MKKYYLFLLFSLFVSCMSPVYDGIYESKQKGEFLLFNNNEFVYIKRCGMFHTMGRGKYNFEKRNVCFVCDSLSKGNNNSFLLTLPTEKIYNGDTFAFSIKQIRKWQKCDSIRDEFIKQRIDSMKGGIYYDDKFDW